MNHRLKMSKQVQTSSKLDVARSDQDKTQEEPDYCLSGDRHTDGMNLTQAFTWNVRTRRCNAKRETWSGDPTRVRVSKCSTGAERLVVVMKLL